MNRLTCAVSGIVVLLAVLASPGTREAVGQFRITTTEAPSSKVGIGPLFDTDQRKVRLFQQAKKLAEQGNYTLSIQILQKILDSKQDSLFYEDEDKKNKFLSLKTEALRILGALPPKGQAAYELKYGLQAKQLLKEAINAGDITGIEEVARRYFHTQAGYKATYLIGTCEMDRSNSLAAALEFDRLRKIPRATRTLNLEPMLSLKAAVCWGRAGLPNMSVKSLVDLKNATPGNTLTIGGKRIYLFDGKEDALKWLVATLGGLEGFQTIGQEKWTMFRGNPSRTAISSKASPVWDSLWTTTTVRDAALIAVDRKSTRLNSSH